MQKSCGATICVSSFVCLFVDACLIPDQGFGGPGGGGGTTGSRLFERWAAPHAQDGNFNGAAGNSLLGHNWSDSEADMSMASTTGSGTRTPQSCDTADGAGGQFTSSPGDDGDHDASGPRKQVAMLVGYVGSEFSSFDCGSGAARTVEGEVIKALRKSGAVSSNDSLERIGWSRSARSFEGEHASCQSVAFDCVSFRSSMQSLQDRLNSRLPLDVRVLNTAPCGHEPLTAAGPQPPAKKRYDASGDATSVTFDYCVPSAFLAPIPEDALRGGPQVCAHAQIPPNLQYFSRQSLGHSHVFRFLLLRIFGCLHSLHLDVCCSGLIRNTRNPRNFASWP